jgi:hypothetical protein
MNAQPDLPQYVVKRAAAENTNRMPPLLTYGEALRCTAEITRRSEAEVAAELRALQAGADAPVVVAAGAFEDCLLGRVPAPAMVWTAEGFLADRERAALLD